MTGQVVRGPEEKPHQCTPGIAKEQDAPERWSLHLAKEQALTFPPGTVWECSCSRQWVSIWGMSDPNEPEHVRWVRHQPIRWWCDQHPVALWLILSAVVLAVAAVLTAAGVLA